MASFMSLRDAVSQNLKDGNAAAFEGFTHLIPHAAAHEAIRQGFKDLTLIRMTPDLVYDQMVGMGMARKLVFSYIGNPGVGLLRRARDAIENGWPNRPKSRSTAIPAWPTPMRQAPPACPARSSVATRARAWRRSMRTSNPSPVPSPARNLPPFPPFGPM